MYMCYVYFRDCDRLESDWGIILFVVGGKDGMGYVDQGLLSFGVCCHPYNAAVFP